MKALILITSVNIVDNGNIIIMLIIMIITIIAIIIMMITVIAIIITLIISVMIMIVIIIALKLANCNGNSTLGANDHSNNNHDNR